MIRSPVSFLVFVAFVVFRKVSTFSIIRPIIWIRYHAPLYKVVKLIRLAPKFSTSKFNRIVGYSPWDQATSNQIWDPPCSIFWTDCLVTRCFFDNSLTNGVNRSKSMFAPIRWKFCSRLREELTGSAFPHKGTEAVCLCSPSTTRDRSNGKTHELTRQIRESKKKIAMR